MPSLTLVVAATLTNGIGQGSRLPWRLPQELSYFARVTTSAPEGKLNSVIMGRNTWESIPPKFRPLPRRLNVVISTNERYFSEKPPAESTTSPTLLQPSLQAAIQSAINYPNTHRHFIIGGASIYKESLLPPPPSTSSSSTSDAYTLADRILMTRVLSPAFDDCDVFMPEFREMKTEDGALLWERAEHGALEEWIGGTVPSGVQEENGVKYEFQMWTRRDAR